ncbi:Sodium:neurotransmitter symporter family protein [Oesophagostomum dentatum]|uniref:Sodium:neurotransmitter symporter family protein n=1 Tax=Oesophagostomum dentatum TaxID=61180 RepID=A0A0B1T6G7_OESDE|nr:Sodium:neurotransmitter symporter family protein [Oesophagostomum dentatum]
MDNRIIKLRELVSTDANYAAQFYLECVCHADETERILNRTSSRDNKRRRKPKGLREAVSTLSVPTIRSVPSTTGIVEVILPQRSVSEPQPRWWERFSIHGKEEEFEDGHHEVRHLWKTQTDFFLACLGLMVGIGNMLRFPGKICEYGAIFFVPYFVCLVFIGFPMLYLHMCIGQYAGKTADVAFAQFMPVSRGLGWAFVLAAIPLIIYHNILITWSLQYLWFSALYYESNLWILVITPEDDLVDFSPLGNVTLTSSELFFHLDILSLTDYTQLSITLPERHIVLALATAWLIVFMGVCRGNTWMSWAIRFTATIPYLMLFILLIRGLSLPGASLGLTFLFSSASDDISSLKLWSAAAEQVLFEIGVGVGAVFSISAYSRFRNNVYRDAALLITMFDLPFAILSAITDDGTFQRRLDVHTCQHGPIFLPWITINLIRAGNLYDHKPRPLVHNFYRNPQHDVTNALGSSLDEHTVYDNLLHSSGC